MSHESVARRYARAVFELSKEAGRIDATNREMLVFNETCQESAELKAILDNPFVSEVAREALLKEIAARLGLSELSTNAIRLLAQRRRLSVLNELTKELSRLVDEETGIVRAKVTSATKLSDAYVAQLKSELERSLGKRVHIDLHEDPNLIAGVVTRIGDRVIDGSARARLEGLRSAILQG